MLEFFASKEDLKQGLENLEERIDEKMREHKSEIMTAMDEQTGILRKLEQEMTFGFNRVDKLENRMDEAEADIANLKIEMTAA